MSSVVNDTRIPNNVDLSSDKKLQRALEEWQPNFIKWWGAMGPEGFQQDDVFLRTAISVDGNDFSDGQFVLLEGRAGDSDTFDSSAIDNRHDVITGLCSGDIHGNLTSERDTIHKLASGLKRIAFKINAPLVVSDI